MLAAGCAALLLGGCGSSGGDLDSSAAALLQRDVAAVETAARRGDRTATERALAVLSRHVQERRAAGEISAERASRVMAAASAVGRSVPAARPSPAVKSPSATPRPTGGTDGRGGGKKKDDEQDGDD